MSFYTNIEGKVLLNNYTNSFVANGTFLNFKEFSGDLNVNIDNCLYYFIRRQHCENKYNVNNISSMFLVEC